MYIFSTLKYFKEIGLSYLNSKVVLLDLKSQNLLSFSAYYSSYFFLCRFNKKSNFFFATFLFNLVWSIKFHLDQAASSII